MSLIEQQHLPTAPSLVTRGVVLACLVLAPVAELIEQWLSPLAGTSTRADLVAIRDHQSAFVAAVLVGLVATIAYVPAYVGLARTCLLRSPVLGRIGGCLAVVSMMGFCGVRMMQAVQLQAVRDGINLDDAAGLVDHTAANPIGAVLLSMFLGGTVIGVLCLAGALWRSRFPRPAVVLLVLFPLADLAMPGQAGSLVAHLILVAALVWLAMALPPASAAVTIRSA